MSLWHISRGNPLSPHRLLFSIGSKRSFICTFPQTGEDILWWTSCGPLVGMENSPNCKCFCHTGSIRHAGGSKPLELSALHPALCSTPAHPHYIYYRVDILSFMSYRNNLSDHVGRTWTCARDTTAGWLLGFYVLAISKGTSVLILICDNVDSWRLHSAAPTGTPGQQDHALIFNSVTSSWHWLDKSLPYPNNHNHNPNTCLGNNEHQFTKSLVWIEEELNSRHSTRERALHSTDSATGVQ